MSIEQDITRREAVRAAGMAGAAYIVAPSLLAACSNPRAAQAATQAATKCAKLTPELTEGPYWVNTMLRRADVRANTKTAGSSPGVGSGVPLELTINVLDASKDCKPLDGVAVDIWHANAHGVYSDETSQQAGGGTSGGDTSGENFLRGYQITGKDPGLHRKPVAGQVSFKTIWPGWYTSRAIHIHVRVRKLSSQRCNDRRLHDTDLLLRHRQRPGAHRRRALQHPLTQEGPDHRRERHRPDQCRRRHQHRAGQGKHHQRLRRDLQRHAR